MKGFPVNLTVAKYSALWLCMSATLTIVRFRFGVYEKKWSPVHGT